MAEKSGRRWGWTEHGGVARNQATGGGETNMTRFEEVTGVMREKGGDKGAIMVTTRNQEIIKGTDTESTLSGNVENLNVVLDTKRRHTEINQSIMDHWPINMITDGPQEGKTENANDVNVSKNLYGVGSGYQAHRES